MTHFILTNKQQVFYIEDYLDSYLTKKPADCILHSEDGVQFKIHKEVFGQTEFMWKILKSAKGQCCSMIEISCPCKKEDLRHLVNFLYDGEIHCNDETASHKIFDNLHKIFGFPQNMHLQCQESSLDEYSNDPSICKVIEGFIEDFENITNESSSEIIPLKQDKQVKVVPSDIVKSNEDGTVKKRKLTGKKHWAKNEKFVCGHCGFTSISKSNLEIHVKGVHLKTKPFKCNQCEASFLQSAGFFVRYESK